MRVTLEQFVAESKKLGKSKEEIIAKAEELSAQGYFDEAPEQEGPVDLSGEIPEVTDFEQYRAEDRQALEEMYEIIAEQLDSTPVFAQLIDEVTESARKIR